MHPRLVVSCHAERLGDDDVCRAVATFRDRLPLRITMLVRPPEPDEDANVWLERAHDAAAHGPFGLHTHFVGARHARPAAAGPEHGERVREQIRWMRERGLEPRYFCGGGWFVDDGVLPVLAAEGLVDCTATSFRPAYLAAGAPRLGLAAPARIRLDETTTLVEIPTTHSIGAAVRAAVRLTRGPVVHVYFHDSDLLDSRRRLALRAALAALHRRCIPSDLDELAAEQAPEVAIGTLARR